MRLIDADALVQNIVKRLCIRQESVIIKEIYNAPTIEPKTKVIAQITFDENKMREIVYEAVERIEDALNIDIVFCPNCRFCREDGGYANCNGYLYCTKKKSLVNEDDYCSWGKER